MRRPAASPWALRQGARGCWRARLPLPLLALVMRALRREAEPVVVAPSAPACGHRAASRPAPRCARCRPRSSAPGRAARRSRPAACSVSAGSSRPRSSSGNRDRVPQPVFHADLDDAQIRFDQRELVAQRVVGPGACRRATSAGSRRTTRASASRAAWSDSISPTTFASVLNRKCGSIWPCQQLQLRFERLPFGALLQTRGS